MVVISGTTTTATLQLSSAASGTAMLTIGHAPAGGTPQSAITSVAPGGTASVSLTPVGFGMMRVHVDMEDDIADEGVLTVTPPGPSNEAIKGDTNRRYSVVDEA